MPLLDIPNEFTNSTANATTLAAGAKPVDANRINENFEEIIRTLDGGMVNQSLLIPLTGSIDPAASTAVIGVNTLFLTELRVGDSIIVSSETRVVDTITDNTHLTVTVAFSDNANDTSPDKTLGGDGLDDDNFRQVRESRILFDNAGHDHTGGVNGKLITESPESGVVWNTSSGHDHDGTDSTLLALATEEDQGAVKAVTGTTDPVAPSLSVPVEVALTAPPENIYCVRVWRLIGGEADNFGIGMINHFIPPQLLATDGYLWRLLDDGAGGSTLQILNTDYDDTFPFKWAVIFV